MYIQSHGRVPESTANHFMQQLGSGHKLNHLFFLVYLYDFVSRQSTVEASTVGGSSLDGANDLNLLLSSGDNNSVLKIADFGFASLVLEPKPTPVPIVRGRNDGGCLTDSHRDQLLLRLVESIDSVEGQRTTQRSDDDTTKRFLLEVADCPGRLDPLSFVGRLASSEDCFERYELTEGRLDLHQLAPCAERSNKRAENPQPNRSNLVGKGLKKGTETPKLQVVKKFNDNDTEDNEKTEKQAETDGEIVPRSKQFEVAMETELKEIEASKQSAK
ncbi:hypothetical protein Cgig2_004410 [Carnegiea gigantea]|uniref:Protein kinase domain-containing protein n=1 Tax=Carnegiea gigantea TaxID=171969 RepID=A0A9Q1JZ81_9CARY|nr:hypothetical protein Cgig2_004410 [Carnegiea gigantea]